MKTPAMKTLLLLTALALAHQLRAAEPAPTQTFDAELSMSRAMVAAPNGQRICLSMFQFKLPNQSLSLNAADKATEKLGSADTNKPFAVTISQDAATKSTVIVRVEQAGKTLYVRPEPVPTEPAPAGKE